jgi:hypothetical protein
MIQKNVAAHGLWKGIEKFITVNIGNLFRIFYCYLG